MQLYSSISQVLRINLDYGTFHTFWDAKKVIFSVWAFSITLHQACTVFFVIPFQYKRKMFDEHNKELIAFKKCKFYKRNIGNVPKERVAFFCTQLLLKKCWRPELTLQTFLYKLNFHSNIHVFIETLINCQNKLICKLICKILLI